MIGAGAQVKLLHRRPEQTLASIINAAVLSHLGRPHVGV
jgi:hypothetical protein